MHVCLCGLARARFVSNKKSLARSLAEGRSWPSWLCSCNGCYPTQFCCRATTATQFDSKMLLCRFWGAALESSLVCSRTAIRQSSFAVWIDDNWRQWLQSSASLTTTTTTTITTNNTAAVFNLVSIYESFVLIYICLYTVRHIYFL